jgi:hypothetical protein
MPTSVGETESEEAPRHVKKTAPPAAQLAPGQKWDPSRKIKFAAPKRVVQRPGIVFALDAERKPQPKKALLGITDGSATEVISGEIKPGDAVIIGDSMQTTLAPTAQGPFFGGFGRGGGGGRGN